MAAFPVRSALSLLGVVGVLVVVTVVALDVDSVDERTQQSPPSDIAGGEAPHPPADLPVVDLPTSAEPLATPKAASDTSAALVVPATRPAPPPADAARLHVLVVDEDDEPLAGTPIELDLGSSVEAGRLFPLVVPRAALKWLTPIRVEVVDARGEPVGGISVVLESVPRHAPVDSNTIDRAETARVGEDVGIAEIPRTRLIKKMNAGGRFGYVMDYRVRVDGAFRDSPSAVIRAEPSDEVPRLQLPPAGEVVLRIVDQAEAPVERGPSVALFTRLAGADDDMRWERMFRHIWEVEDGEVHYAHIGLDLELRFSVSRAGWKGTTVHAPGPTTDGERIELVATMGPAVPSLTGRVVGEDGAPLPDMWLRVELIPNVSPPEHPSSSPRSALWFSLTSDEHGLFRHPLYALASVAGGRTVEVHELRRSGFPSGVIPRFARADLPEPLPAASDVDLGDLVLRPLPVLVSGRVVDELGAPVRHARLFYYYPYGPPDQQRWFNLNVDNRSADTEGVFTLHGVQRIRSLKVRATRKGQGTSEDAVVTPGATGVILQLVPPEPEAKGGIVIGTVLLDPGVPGLELEVFLRWQGGSEDDYVWPTGAYRFEQMPPGIASLEIELQETGFALARVDGIEVRVGETTTVDPIDLRGALRVLEVRLLKDNGNPISKTTCWVASPGDRGGSFRTDRDGRAGLLLPTRHERFSFRTNGYDVAECGWSATEQTLVLVKQDD